MDGVLRQKEPSSPHPSDPARSTVLVIGNGMVGHRFCEKLLAYDTAGRYRIVVLGEEPRPAYDRVHLTSYFSERAADKLLLGTREWYESSGIELALGTRATKIDRFTRTVTTDRGASVHYDTLVLATGSAALRPSGPRHRRPAASSSTAPSKTSTASSSTGRTRSASRSSAAGSWELEAARAVLDAGLETHVIEVAPRLMPRQLDSAASALLERTIRNLGVTVHLDKRLARISGDHKASMASSSSAATASTST